MSIHCRSILSVILLGCLTGTAGTAGATIIEIDPLSAGDLTTDWTVTPDDYEPWSYDYETGVLEGKAKSFKAGEARYGGGRWGTFKLFFQIDKAPRNALILLIPESGDPVEIPINKKWANRRSEWTQCVLSVGGGKASVTAKDKPVGEWDVPEADYGIGFHLKKGGKVKLKRVRIVWDRPPEPEAQLEAGFINVLAPTPGFDSAFRVHTEPGDRSVPGEWSVAEGVLTVKNPEEEGLSQKFTARLSSFQIQQYEFRFKVKSGARNLSLITHIGNGQAGTQQRLVLDGYLTGAGPWHTFVVKLENSRISMSVNGLDVVTGTPAPGTPTRLVWFVGPSGKAEIKDMHIKSPQLRGGAPAGGNAGGANAGGGNQEQPPFFNGEDLKAWLPRPAGTWKIVNGAIFCVHPGPGTASLLSRYRVDGDYTVSFSAELGTAGFSLMTKMIPDPRKESRLQVPADAFKQNWNECKLVVKGTEAKLLVNGTEVAKATVIPGSGFFGFMVAPGGACRLKDLKLTTP